MPIEGPRTEPTDVPLSRLKTVHRVFSYLCRLLFIPTENLQHHMGTLYPLIVNVFTYLSLLPRVTCMSKPLGVVHPLCVSESPPTLVPPLSVHYSRDRP